MSAAVFQVYLFTLPAFGIATVGAVIAALRPPTDKVTSLIQHFAAGIVFAATALELLPKERTQAALPVVIGFALGLALMLLVRQVAGTIEKREQATRYPTACCWSRPSTSSLTGWCSAWHSPVARKPGSSLQPP